MQLDGNKASSWKIQFHRHKLDTLLSPEVHPAPSPGNAKGLLHCCSCCRLLLLELLLNLLLKLLLEHLLKPLLLLLAGHLLLLGLLLLLLLLWAREQDGATEGGRLYEEAAQIEAIYQRRGAPRAKDARGHVA